MKRRITAVEGETLHFGKDDDLAAQLESVTELTGDRCLSLRRRNDVSVDLRLVGHYGFRDGSTLDVIPNTGRRDVSERTLNTMLYGIFNIKDNGQTLNLFEFFIKMFVGDVKRLLRKGFRSSYSLIQSNETVFRGKLLFSENLKENLIHKERVFVEYEIFSPDRPENRIIKTTLEYLIGRSADDRNIKDIKVLLNNLESIPSSQNPSKDMAACKIDRNMGDYVMPLMWCSIFMETNKKAFALLIEPDRVFEAYVAKMSTKRRDGFFSARCRSETWTDEVSVTLVDIDWTYRLPDGQVVGDAETLYLEAGGYSRIPYAGSDRIRKMAAECGAEPLQT